MSEACAALGCSMGFDVCTLCAAAREKCDASQRRNGMARDVSSVKCGLSEYGSVAGRMEYIGS